MRLFKRKAAVTRPVADWLQKLQLSVNNRQRSFADVLNRKTQYWNRSSWVIALALFTMLFGGCCLFLCIKAFIHF